MRITLDPARDVCDHREPLRAGWPNGAEVAMLLLFDAFCEDPRTQEMAPKGPDGLANPEAIPRLLREFGPICCWLGDEVVGEIMAEALMDKPGPRLLAIGERQRPGWQ